MAAGVCCLVALASGCTGDQPKASVGGGSEPEPSTTAEVVAVDPCTDLEGDDGPVKVVETEWSDLPADSVLRDSTLPREFPSAATITASATPLLEDPPGRVSVLAFWGEPGAHEPDADTPTTFLGSDGRWRKLSVSDLGRGEIGWLSESSSSLSPDGSRWILSVGGRYQLVDFSTGDLIDLPSLHGIFAPSWSPDSGMVAFWDNGSAVHVFDRSGRRVAELPIDVGKNSLVLASDNGGVTLARVSGPQPKPRVQLKTYDRNGDVVESLSCVLPSGYPVSRTGVDGYDGRNLWLSALVDRKRWEYRYAMIDVRTGTVVADIQHRGFSPWIDQWVSPGVYTGDFAGGSEGIYGVDPDSGEMVMLTQVEHYRYQGGYENHPYGDLATDLIIGR